MLPLALASEHGHIAHRVELYWALAYAVLVLSVATALLLLALIRQGAVARVTSLFYLVPPVTALMALALFGESLVPLQIMGMLVCGLRRRDCQQGMIPHANPMPGASRAHRTAMLVPLH